ncbi:MAG: DUF3016 domain-containing protein [Rubrivivax sp.]|nr:DUF3016 domain-containing protein [Rubrivivax sp.]
MLLATALALLSAAALVALAKPARAAGTAEVRFVEPEKFTDAGRTSHERERALAALAGHVQQLAQRLPEGQRLRVQFTDVDLAGSERMRGATELRVLRGGADWPKLALRWTLEQGGSAVKSGEQRLSDLGYLFGSRPATPAEGDLPYEKRLLNDWFARQFEGAR